MIIIKSTLSPVLFLKFLKIENERHNTHQSFPWILKRRRFLICFVTGKSKYRIILSQQLSSLALEGISINLSCTLHISVVISQIRSFQSLLYFLVELLIQLPQFKSLFFLRRVLERGRWDTLIIRWLELSRTRCFIQDSCDWVILHGRRGRYLRVTFSRFIFSSYLGISE